MIAKLLGGRELVEWCGLIHVPRVAKRGDAVTLLMGGQKLSITEFPAKTAPGT
jgi:hypothetical protein